MKVEKEMKYEAPEVTVLEVMVEAGFEGSDQLGEEEKHPWG